MRIAEALDNVLSDKVKAFELLQIDRAIGLTNSKKEIYLTTNR